MGKAGRAAAAVVAAWALLAASGCRQSSVDPNARRATRTEVRLLNPRPGELALPLHEGSVRFAVIGDSGRGDQPQHEVAQQMLAWRARDFRRQLAI